MQEVGSRRATDRGFSIESVISDVHELPFPDNHFDVVTLQWASRHLRVAQVFNEIKRVLKPGASFYHCDMLRPDNRGVETLYYAYLKLSLTITAHLFGSGPTAMNCRNYFINALKMFYSVDEMSALLRDLGYEEISSKRLLAGVIGSHRAAKA